jgi:hypothetical protein
MQLEFDFALWIDAEYAWQKKYIWPCLLEALKECMRMENHCGSQLDFSFDKA